MFGVHIWSLFMTTNVVMESVVWPDLEGIVIN